MAGFLVWRGALLVGAAYAARVLRLPLNSWARTDLPDGVGPVTRRTYWLDVAGARRPADTVRDTLRHLPDRVPKALAWFRRCRSHGDLAVGDRFTVLLLGVRRGRVQVAELTEGHFRVQTLRQHSESGWIQFQVLERAGGVQRLQVVSQMRASSWFDRWTYLLGVCALQRLTWEWALRRIARASGGTRLSHGTSTQEWPFSGGHRTSTRREERSAPG